MTAITHATLTFDRTYDAAPARVFAAFESVEARERWAVPEGDRLVYDAADFRPGGVDLCRCGSPDALNFRLESRYLEIVPGARIVLAETTASEHGMLCASLNTIEISPAGSGARLLLTLQMAAMEPAILDGAERGWTAVLDNLIRELRRAAA